GTVDSPLYQAQVYAEGCDIIYTKSVPDGTYTVDLKLAETFFSSAGQRVFNVIINGTTVDTNLDPYARAGGTNTAYDAIYTATATGGTGITIRLQRVTQNPTFEAIQISQGFPLDVYYYENADTFTGESCASGCTVVVPAHSQSTLYANAVYF